MAGQIKITASSCPHLCIGNSSTGHLCKVHSTLMALSIGHKVLFPPDFIACWGKGKEKQRSSFHSPIQLIFNHLPFLSGCSLTSSKDKHSLSHFLDAIPFDLAVVCASRSVFKWHDSVVVRYGSSLILFSRRDGYFFRPTIDGCFLT